MQPFFKFCLMLLLTATCFPITVVDAVEQATTCDFYPLNIHRLSCQHGVISVEQSLFGRTNSFICNEGVASHMVANTKCAQDGTLERVKSSCNGKTLCELNTGDFRTPDPCVGTLKYLQTNYTCLDAIIMMACETSEAYLHCDPESKIVVHGANYGRRDRNTCAFQKPLQYVKNTECTHPTNIVADRCNGKNSCTIKVSNKVFGDPCKGTYKYLEVAYSCEGGRDHSYGTQ
ncbi:L-rhamnose-binding lectin SML-like [Corythoichthys intestinalis]|uniref:L-rhamnose-binding lectin SML-like n=1 Tax=Corythoichthys intestinalis TaxID=161448 RepID=UPI0025A51152|nr:L-rhamnose-binding lectin SML-like [Corythoichthys intestinalis]